MDGWIDEWRMDKEVDGKIATDNIHTDKESMMDGWMGKPVDGWMGKPVDGQMDGWANQWMDRWMVA